MLTVEDLKRDGEIKTLLALCEKQLEVLGYTEHSFRHIAIVVDRAAKILKALGADERETELGKIAAYLHDIGNIVNRNDHAQSGAIMAYNLLTKRGMDYKDAAEVMIAIGNHDEHTGLAVSRISAALILSDKSDVHRSRVRNKDRNFIDGKDSRDIHDRVNFAVEESDVIVDTENKIILFKFTVDTAICSAMDYFEIFLDRMKLCKKAAEYLGFTLRLVINDYNLV